MNKTEDSLIDHAHECNKATKEKKKASLLFTYSTVRNHFSCKNFLDFRGFFSTLRLSLETAFIF